MAENKELKVRLQNASKTEAQWKKDNPIAKAGEIMISSDKNMLKIGDGVTHWDKIDYIKSSNLDGLTATITELNNVSGVTSNIQTQINNKADSSSVYTKTNIDSMLGSYAVNKTLTNENLNNVTTAGFYNAAGNNTVTNGALTKGTAFGLVVTHNAAGSYYTQIQYSGAGEQYAYKRTCVGGTWGGWTQIVTDNLTSTSTTSALSANQGKVLNDKIDGIKIGGRNLLKNSKEQLSPNTGNATRYVYKQIVNAPLDISKDYIFSAKVKNVKNNSNNAVCVILFNDNISSPCSTRYNVSIINGKITTPFLSSSLTGLPAKVLVYGNINGWSESETGSLDVYEWKLEESTIASDWTPAPEDIQSQIDTNKTNISTNTSNISSLTTRVGTAETNIGNKLNTSTFDKFKDDNTKAINSAKDSAVASAKKYTDDKVVDGGHGGTGKTSLQASAHALLHSLDEWGADPKDDGYFIRYSNDKDGSYGRVKFSTLWNYIKGKTDTTYLPLSGGILSGKIFINTTNNDKTQSTNSYNEGLRINRNTGNNWATLAIGGANNSTSGTGEGVWLLGASGVDTNKGFFIVENGSTTDKGLYLAGKGGSTIQWRGKNILASNNIKAYTADSVTTANRTTKGTRTVLSIWGSTYGNDAKYLEGDGYLSWGDPSPQIRFGTQESENGQELALIYTDHDTIGTGVSLSLVSNQGDAYFIAPHIKARSGFVGNLTGNVSGDFIGNYIGSKNVPINTLSNGHISYYYNVNMNLEGNMPCNNNANSILSLSRHGGNYMHQIGFSSDGTVYKRYTNGSALSNSDAWVAMLDASNYSSYSLPLTGGTLTGNLNFSGTPAIQWNDGDWRQRIHVVDDSTANTNVFEFQQSEGDTGKTWKNLMVIKDNSEIVATKFTGSLNGNATSATRIVYQGNHTEAASGTTANAPSTGMLYGNSLYLTGTYQDSNTPVSFGNIINIAGAGTGQLLAEWSGRDSTTGHLYYRSHRDTSSGGWGAWKKVVFSDDTINNATNATTAQKAILLFPDSSVIGTATSTWQPLDASTYKRAWGQSFTNSSLSNDTGDINYFLSKNGTGTILSVCIDGEYYAAGNKKVIREGNSATLTGDVTGSASFNNSGNVSVSAFRKGCIAVNNANTDNTKNKPWYKFASIALRGTYVDRQITFSVIRTYNDSAVNSGTGMLKAHVRVDGNGKYESAKMNWLFVNGGINPDNFVIAYKNGTYTENNTTKNQCTVELWCKINEGNVGYAFNVIGEENRNSRLNASWALYNTVTDGSQASIPSDFTQVKSTLASIKNPIYDASGNGNTVTLSYGKSGLGASGVNWFAAWNGYELRAISPSNLRQNISALSSTTANGYEGMGRKDGNTSDWIRTTSNGIIPYQSGGAGSGHSSLGTSSWYFSNAYVDNIHAVSMRIDDGVNTGYSQINGSLINTSFIYNKIGYDMVSIRTYDYVIKDTKYENTGRIELYSYNQDTNKHNCRITLDAYNGGTIRAGIIDTERMHVRPNGVDSAKAQVLIGDDITNGSIELYGTNPFIDFHANNSTADYTSRIIESSSGVISVNDWKHKSGQLYIDHDSGYCGINRYGSGQAFWAGGSDLTGNNASFRVNHSGHMITYIAETTGEFRCSVDGINFWAFGAAAGTGNKSIFGLYTSSAGTVSQVDFSGQHFFNKPVYFHDNVWFGQSYYQTSTGGANTRLCDIGATAYGGRGVSRLARSSSSSIRYKDVIRTLTSNDVDKLFDIPTYLFKYKKDYVNKDDERYLKDIYGFIVEDWDKVLPIAIDHNSDGTPEMWNNQIITPLMFEMIKSNKKDNKEQHDEIELLKSEIRELKKQLKQALK